MPFCAPRPHPLRCFYAIRGRRWLSTISPVMHRTNELQRNTMEKKRIPWLCDTRKCRGGCHIIASVAAPRDFFSFLFMYSRSISDACDRFSNRLHAICAARTRNTNAVRPAVMGSQMTNIIGRYLCISNKEACSLLSVLPVLSVLLYSLRPVASKLCCCQTRVRFRYYVIHFVKWVLFSAWYFGNNCHYGHVQPHSYTHSHAAHQLAVEWECIDCVSLYVCLQKGDFCSSTVAPSANTPLHTMHTTQRSVTKWDFDKIRHVAVAKSQISTPCCDL